ncbi:MAG: hypothetical protein KDK89_04595 [Alphaproteobacteria bacterium]|nr:hypothetical protein [Alphaproteobacteria bacterium]
MGAQATSRQRPWPKLHLIYFLLAIFDLIAVGGGLFLSHQLSSLFERNVATNAEWSERFVALWKLGDLASTLNAPSNDVFDSRNPDLEREKLELAGQAINREIAAIRTEMKANVPPDISRQPLRVLGQVEQTVAIMMGHGERSLSHYKSGDIEKSAMSMALMDRSFAQFRIKLNDAIQSVRDIQTAYGRGFAAQVGALKHFEYMIGGAIVFMVCCVVLYGHWVGSFMTRKYKELEEAHEASRSAEEGARQSAGQLQAINEDVSRLNRELESNLTTLREAQDELLRKGRLSQLGQLTATVAHELRNPLGAVRTSAFLLERKLKSRGLGVETQLERINNGVTRCDAIISQLLDFARTKKLQCDSQPLDDWLAKLIEEEAQSIPEEIAVECHLGAGDAQVEFDSARMSRVLINLISNATEAMTGKKGNLPGTTTGSPRIVISSRLTERGAEINVSDNGPGMDEPTQKRILEPLFTTKSFGTGLGLPAVEKIMEQHGGGISIRSKPGEGASFTVWWPRHYRTQESA